MAVFEKEIPTKIILDDTDPLTFSISSTQTVDNHTEYVIRVQRRLCDERKWNVSRRYNDFVRLHSHLSISKLPFQLPPKKLLGNMDREFVVQRQAGLQEYLELVLSSPLCNSLQVKRFLDPENYCQPFNEQALQHVSMALRSDLRFEIVKPLEEVGWRIRKHYFSVRRSSGENKGDQLLLSWAPNGPDQHLDHRQLNKVITALSNLKHPHIEQPLLMTVGEAGGVVVRRLANEGSLKDVLYSVKPCDSWIGKISHFEKAKPVPQRDAARIGAQILDTLLFLSERGLHYGHLHPGNILLGEGGEVKLLDLENSLLGLPCIYRPHLVHLRKVHSPESVDAYCFGHTLYEMALGRQLNTPTCDTSPPDCSPLLWSLLESILSTEVCRKGLPSLAQLRAHSFFAGVPRAATSSVSLQLSSQLRQALATAYSKAEARLRDDQKKMRQQRRQARVQQHLIQEEQQQQQQRKSSRPPRPPKTSSANSSQAAVVNGKSPERSDSPASTNTSGGTLTPPPGPAAVDAARGSAEGEGLSALLGSICSFDKGSLRNTGGSR